MSANVRQVSSPGRQCVIRWKNLRMAGIEDCKERITDDNGTYQAESLQDPVPTGFSVLRHPLRRYCGAAVSCVYRCAGPSVPQVVRSRI